MNSELGVLFLKHWVVFVRPKSRYLRECCGILRLRTLRKYAVWAFEFWQTFSDKIFTFEKSYESFSSRLTDTLNWVAIGTLWKIGEWMLTGFPENSHFVEGNLAISRGKYGVLPKHGGSLRWSFRKSVSFVWDSSDYNYVKFWEERDGVTSFG